MDYSESIKEILYGLTETVILKFTATSLALGFSQR